MKTLEELREAIDTYSLDYSDSVATMRSMKFGQGNSLTFTPDLAGNAYMFTPDSAGNAYMQGRVNDWAFNQICGRLNVPAGWVGDERNCPEELKLEILNELSGKWREDANFLIRMKGEVIRAVLSSKYSKFDNKEFLDLASEAVQTMGIEPQVYRAEVNDDMRAYIVFPQVTIAPDPENRDRGGLHPSLYISNSERGGGSARVAGAVFRSICTNGLIYGWSQEAAFNVRHIFHSRAAMGLLVAEGIAEGLKMSEKATRKFIEAQDIKVPKVSLAGLVDGWATKYGISVEAKTNWLSAITTEAASYARLEDVRLYDMVNAATYVSQTRPSVETELMERMAGDILSSRWSA